MNKDETAYLTWRITAELNPCRSTFVNLCLTFSVLPGEFDKSSVSMCIGSIGYTPYLGIPLIRIETCWQVHWK